MAADGTSSMGKKPPKTRQKELTIIRKTPTNYSQASQCRQIWPMRGTRIRSYAYIILRLIELCKVEMNVRSGYIRLSPAQVVLAFHVRHVRFSSDYRDIFVKGRLLTSTHGFHKDIL